MYFKVVFAVFAIAFILNASNAFDLSSIPNQANNMAKQGIDAANGAAQTLSKLPGLGNIPGANQMVDLASKAAEMAKGMADQANSIAQQATKIAQQMMPKK